MNEWTKIKDGLKVSIDPSSVSAVEDHHDDDLSGTLIILKCGLCYFVKEHYCDVKMFFQEYLKLKM